MSALKQARGIEAIAVRRAKLADAEKARYRVYSSPTEFVAVIAESALVAIKVAGVNEPYRIVRDLPTEVIALEADKIAKAEEAHESVKFSTVPKAPKMTFKTDISAPAPQLDTRFVPLKLRDLSTTKKFDSFIVPHEVLNQLIEAVRKPAPPPAAPPPEAPKAAAPVMEQAPPPIEAIPKTPTPAAAAPSESGVLSKDEVDNLLKE